MRGHGPVPDKPKLRIFLVEQKRKEEIEMALFLFGVMGRKQILIKHGIGTPVGTVSCSVYPLSMHMKRINMREISQYP